jgi:hypothetical protein
MENRLYLLIHLNELFLGLTYFSYLKCEEYTLDAEPSAPFGEQNIHDFHLIEESVKRDW